MNNNLNKFHLKGGIHKLTLLSIVLFFLLLFTVHRGYNISAALLALIAIVALPITWPKKNQLKVMERADIHFLVMLCAYGLGLIFINLIHDNPLKSYENSIKFVLAAPIFLLVYRYPINPLHIFLIILVSSLLGSAMGYFNLTHGYSFPGRASVGKINPIHYGALMQLFACINLIGTLLSEKINNSKLRTLYVCTSVLAAAAGMYLSILSYSRGVWLALPIQLFVIALFFFKYYKKKVIIASLICVAAMVSTYFIPHLKIKQRINTTLNSITLYTEGDAATSTGMRMDMYKFALVSSQEAPLLGTPSTELTKKLHTLIDTNEITPAIKNTPHLHSHYFDTLAHYGITGLILLVSLYVFALRAFAKYSQNNQKDIRTVAFAGIITLVSYAIYNITDVLLQFNVGILTFVTLLPTLLGACSTKKTP